MIDKAEAQKEAIRLWRNKPPMEPRTYTQAVQYAALVAPLFDFRTMGDRAKVVEGWFVRDVMKTEEAVKILEDVKQARMTGNLAGTVLE